MLVLKKEIRLLPSPVNTPVLLFILTTSFSLLIGNLPLIPNVAKAGIASQVGAWLLYTFSVGSLLLVGNNVRDIRWLKFFTWTFLILGSIYLAFCWRYGIWGANWRFFQEGISTSIFWIMLAALGFGQALCNDDLPWHWRVLAGGICVAGLAFGWIRGKGWISGWLPPLIAVWIIIWLRSWKLGLFVTLIGGAAFLLLNTNLMSSVNTEDQQWSTYSRWLTWEIMYKLVKINPIFGLGPANYYHYTPLYAIYGYYVNFNSHNNYWDMAAQTGLLGLGLFVWIVYALTRLGLSLRKRVRDGFSRAYVNTALAVLAASVFSGMLADWFLPFLYNIGFAGFRTSVLAWLFLGGLLSLDFINQSTSNSLQSGES
jgi:O-antigen ligase